MATTGHEGYVKLQAWVKQELWEELNYQGITSPTSALTQGLQLLLDTTKSSTQNYQETTIAKARLEEQEKRINDLNRIIDKLIGSKEKPSKTSTEEIKPAVQVSEEKPASSPGGAQTGKHIIEKICKNCGETFEAVNPKKETCSAKCRTAFNRRK